MSEYCRIWLRAFAIVTFTSCNVAMIARWQWSGAFVTSFAISGIWWSNAHAAAHRNRPWAWAVYGFGAGCGNLTGMGLAYLLGHIF